MKFRTMTDLRPPVDYVREIIEDEREVEPMWLSLADVTRMELCLLIGFAVFIGWMTGEAVGLVFQSVRILFLHQ